MAYLLENHIRHLYKLQTFGIDPVMVPIGDNGQPLKDKFVAALEHRRSYEEQRRRNKSTDDDDDDADNTNQSGSSLNHPHPTTRIDSTPTAVASSTSSGSDPNALPITPKAKDVLFGRGRQYHDHPGNIVLDRLILAEIPRHSQASSSFTKTCIVVGIIQRIHDLGGRFLRINVSTKEWSVVNDGYVRMSIGSRFRYASSNRKYYY